jgi:hypothetical protein
MTEGRVLTQVYLKPDGKRWITFLGKPRFMKKTIEGMAVGNAHVIVERSEVQWSKTFTEDS